MEELHDVHHENKAIYEGKGHGSRDDMNWSRMAGSADWQGVREQV